MMIVGGLIQGKVGNVRGNSSEFRLRDARTRLISLVECDDHAPDRLMGACLRRL